MFRIRERNKIAFARAALDRFELRMAASVHASFPVHAAMLGPEGVGRLLQHAERVAEDHGIVHERGVEEILWLVLLLGGSFDRDPALPWAAAILADTSQGPIERANALYATAVASLDRVAGPRSEHLLAAFAAARRWDAEAVPRGPSADVSAVLAPRLRALYPEKCAELGDEGLGGLVRSAIARAARHGIAGERGVTAIAFAMLLLGHGFDEDPAMPWIQAALAEPAANETERVDRFLQTSREALDRWLGIAAGAS